MVLLLIVDVDNFFPYDSKVLCLHLKEYWGYLMFYVKEYLRLWLKSWLVKLFMIQSANSLISRSFNWSLFFYRLDTILLLLTTWKCFLWLIILFLLTLVNNWFLIYFKPTYQTTEVGRLFVYILFQILKFCNCNWLLTFWTAWLLFDYGFIFCTDAYLS